MAHNDATPLPPETRRLSAWLPRFRYFVPVIVGFGLLLPWVYGHVRDARERARRTPHVFVFGTGGPQYTITWISGSGEPPFEEDRLVGEAVNRFVDDDLPRQIEFVRWAKSKGLPHSWSVQLCIGAPRLSATALGRLHAIPRTDGIHLGIQIGTSGITDDGLLGLKSLASVDSLVLCGTRIPSSAAAALRNALPNCTVDVEEAVAN
jgi:hypothetical protein